MAHAGSTVAIALFATMMALPAPAQEINPLVRERINVNVNEQRREMPVRVQVGINIMMPGPSGDSEAAMKLRERARRTIYEMAAAECRLLEELLAKTCRLESISLNVNRQQMVGQIEGIMANGNFTMQIFLK